MVIDEWDAGVLGAVLGCFYRVYKFFFICASDLMESQRLTARTVELNSSFMTNSTPLTYLCSHMVAYFALIQGGTDHDILRDCLACTVL